MDRERTSFRSGRVGGLAHLSPPLVATSTTEAAPPIAVSDGWEARTVTLPRQVTLALPVQKELDPMRSRGVPPFENHERWAVSFMKK
jgi:hypothetical protein